jgi:hypothetical protein
MVIQSPTIGNKMDNLQTRAQARMTEGKDLYNAGWENGEWTCAHCFTMIGKNLKDEKPFSLARQHAGECQDKNSVFFDGFWVDKEE